MLKGGTLHFNKGYSSLECVIRDLSATGARIQMGETFGVPSRFTMSISGETTRIEASSALAQFAQHRPQLSAALELAVNAPLTTRRNRNLI